MRFTDRQKAIRKEKQYAERRFTQLLECVDRIAKDATENQIEEILLELDRKWRKFAENLIYLNRGGRDEFIKIARERAFKAIKVEA